MEKKECFGQFVTSMDKYAECRECADLEECLSADHDRDLIKIKGLALLIGWVICAVGLFWGLKTLYGWVVNQPGGLTFWAGLFILIAMGSWGASVIVSALQEKKELASRIKAVI